MSKALYPLAQELLFSAGSQPREAEESKKRKLDQLLIDDAALDRADADVVLNYLSLIVSAAIPQMSVRVPIHKKSDARFPRKAHRAFVSPNARLACV